MHNRNGQLQIPGQISVGVNNVVTPFCRPTVSTIQAPGGLMIQVFGGLLVVEELAARFLAGGRCATAAEAVALANELLSLTRPASQEPPQADA